MIRTYDVIKRLGNSFHIELLEHGLYRGDETWRYDRMRSPYNRMYFTLEGEASVGNDVGSALLQPGVCALVPFDSENDYRCPVSFIKFYVHFRIDLHHGPDLFQGLPCPMVQQFDTDRLRTLLDALASDSVTSVLQFRAFLFEFIAGFLDRLPPGFRQRFSELAKYSGLASFVRNRPSARLTLQDIATYAGRPLKSLSHEYLRDTGTPLRTLLNRNLLQAAQEHLLLTDKTIRQIALELEFCDEFYFSRYFRRHAGLPPSEYRKRFRMTAHR